jgi:p-hydroxybenzoate 3-monooxygenase
VAIVGAGPAGLTLGLLLRRAGIESTILEARDRDYIERRMRAGLLEQGTVELLGALGVDGRLQAEARRHDTFELRFAGRRHEIPMRELTDGRGTWMYAQQEMVKDLVADRLDAGEPLVFDAGDVRLSGLDTARPAVHYRHEGVEQTLSCDIVAGCDGFHGVCRPSIPAGAVRMYAHAYPYAWLGILADAPPATTDRLIYAHHPRGFALHSFRSEQVTRCYLQVEPGEDLNRWPEDRIWRELQTRLSTGDGWSLNEGPIRQVGLTPMRSFVTEPMQYGNLFLAGDAAHIVPPTAAKGLNLAIADVCVLADAIAAFLVGGDREPLDRYSEVALRRVWQVQEFSAQMTAMFHHCPTDVLGARLQRAQLERLCASTAAMTAFCEAYVGLPPATRELAAGPFACRRQLVAG